MAGTAGETVDGGRTVESLGLASERARRIDANLADAYASERYTLRLRTIWFPTVDVAYVLPVVAALAWGGWLVANGHASVGEVTTVALYIQQLADPVDRLLSWLDEVQVGGASFARLVGIADVPPDRTATGEEPEDDWLRAHDVRYAYVAGPRRPARDRARPRAGRADRRRRAVGRGQVDARPAARRASTRPRTGSVEVGGVPLVDLELDTLRREVALVTQEQHVFVGTLADNLRLARAGSTDDELLAALDAVDATDWMRGASRRPRDRRRRRRRTAHAGPDAAARPRPARARRPAHARARRGDLAARPARGAPSRALAGLGAHRAAPSSRSPTASTPPTTPTGSRWSRTGCCRSSAPTTS